jgi:hypothetical protein
MGTNFRLGLVNRPVIQAPADCLDGLADSGVGRRVLGWWAMARERDHGTDRRAFAHRGAGGAVPGGAGRHRGAALSGDLAAGAGADLPRSRGSAGLRAALGGAAGATLQCVRSGRARRSATPEWPPRHRADRRGAGRLGSAGADAARRWWAMERSQGRRPGSAHCAGRRRLARYLGLQTVHPQRGWEALQRIDWSIQAPRPRHARAATPEQQAKFKRGSRPPSRRPRQRIPIGRSRSGRRTSTASA